LYRCGNCALKFRHPRLPKAMMDTLYEQGGASEWEGVTARRPDWQIAAQWLLVERRSREYRVLDVGCYDGAFLASLGEDVGKFGIEINPGAQVRAQQRGVHIIGRNFQDLRTAAASFDAAVALDVVEHVENPFDFLSQLAGTVKRKGVLIIATGNTDSGSWRLMGSRYWYSAFGEHISFVNPRWCNAVAQACGLQVEEIATFAHGGRTTSKIFSDTLRNLSYRAVPALWRALRRNGVGGHDARRFPALADYPPAWTTARDHFICRFRKH
jgi:SAM-dependent methyltransferase